MIRYALPALLVATPATAQTSGYGHMMNWGYGNSMLVLSVIHHIMAAGFVVALLYVTVWSFCHCIAQGKWILLFLACFFPSYS